MRWREDVRICDNSKRLQQGLIIIVRLEDVRQIQSKRVTFLAKDEAMTLSDYFEMLLISESLETVVGLRQRNLR